MFKLLESSLRQGASYADLYYLEKIQDAINFENNKLTGIRSKNIPGFSLRVKKDGKAGIISSSTADNADQLLQVALDSSVEGEELNYTLPSPAELPAMNLTNERLWEQSYEQYVNDGERLIQLIHAYDPTLSVAINIRREREIKGFLSTNGCDYLNTIDRLAIIAGAVLIQNQSILESFDIHLSRENDYDIEQLANSVIDKIRLGRVETTIKAGKMPVVLTPQATSQLLMAVFTGLSGEMVRQGVSPLKGRIGEQIFSDQITLIDDMLMPGGLETSRFDDEGTPAERTVLYDKGVLKNYFLTLRSAEALGLQPNGKAQRRGLFNPRSYATVPTPSYSNLVMEPGSVSFGEMISGIEEGLVIDSMMGLIMGNLLAGAIDSDIDLAYKIERGKLVGRVKNAAIGMNIYDVLNNQVVAVENQQHKISTDMSSTMLIPHVLLKDINIMV